MTTSKLGITLIKEFESFSPTIYKDAAGYPTIGYGHLIKEGEQFKAISEAEAGVILANDLKEAEISVATLVKVPLNQWQFDALVSFCFNLGGGSLGKSTMLTCLNKGLYALASNEFERWVNAGGVKLAGLVTRRKCEKILFKAGING